MLNVFHVVEAEAEPPSRLTESWPTVQAEGWFLELQQLGEMLLAAEPRVLLTPTEEQIHICPAVKATLTAAQGDVLTGPILEGSAYPVWASTPIFEDGKICGVMLLIAPEYRAAPSDVERLKILQLARVAGDLARGEKAERKVCEQQQMLEMIEDMSGVGWWRVDDAGGNTVWSKRVYEIHGLEPSEDPIPVANGIQFFEDEDCQKIEEAIHHALATGEGYDMRLRMKRADGSPRIVISRSAVERDTKGEVSGLFGVFRDVTDDETMMNKLRRNEARYRLLAENVSDVITRVKMDGSSKYISPAIRQMLGWTLEEMSGQSTDYVYEEDRPKVLKAIKEAVKSGQATRLEHRAVHRNGNVMWVECTFKALKDDFGELDDVVVVIRDASQRKALELEVIEAKERAEKAAEAKTEFLANMSHELRTPLTSVIGYSGLLKDSEGLTEQQKLYAQRIETSSDALLHLINDILDYSKLEAEAVELEKLPFAVDKLLVDTAGIVESQCIDKALQLELKLDDKLPEVLSGDAGRLRQVTLNFLSNAVKFTASGKVTLKAYGVESTDGHYRLRVEVSDTGIGISAHKAKQIFSRFSQADASTTRVYGGTGLGLAISRRLIELMDGRIGFDSVPGVGSTFWYEVPLDFDFALPVSVAVDTTDKMDVQGRILLVDDAAANRELVSIILESLGLEVKTACNGVEAVAAAQAGRFDLVLMDVHMPEMDGLAATREIRLQECEGRRMPILALTANVSSDQVSKCLEAGMDGHLSKPIQVAELAATLRDWLSQEK